MAGLVTNAGISTYYGSKFAQEAFTSCLRMELKAFDLDVVTVNPSVHETPMNDGLGNQISKIWQKLSPELKEEYGEGMFILFVVIVVIVVIVSMQKISMSLFFIFFFFIVLL